MSTDNTFSNASLNYDQVSIPSANTGNTGGYGNNPNPFQSSQAMNNFQMAQGIGGILQGLFGRKKRKREQRAAAAELAKRQKIYESQEYTNLAGNMKNPYENIPHLAVILFVVCSNVIQLQYKPYNKSACTKN